MSGLEKVFELNRQGFDPARGLVALGLLFVPFAVASALDIEAYYLSMAFGAAFIAMSDPGGTFGYRLPRVLLVAVSGALLTALAFGLGDGGWGLIVASVFALTLLGGLAVTFGVHRFMALYLLAIWYLIALTLPAAYAIDGTSNHPWAQAAAWLGGSALWIGFSALVWLARGREPQPQPIPEIPGDVTRRRLTQQIVLFALLRAFAVSLTVAITFGLDLPKASWMPIATIVAMKPSLDQAQLYAAQRLAGAILGAVLAAVVLLTITNKHALELLIVGLAAVAGAVRAVNYALYTAAVAALVLIAEDVPHPQNLTEEWDRIAYTFIGVGIAVAVMLIASRLQARSAPSPSPAT